MININEKRPNGPGNDPDTKIEFPTRKHNMFRLDTVNIYRIVASTNTCYYSENPFFVQRSQYIRTENPLHKQSEKAKTCH